MNKPLAFPTTPAPAIPIIGLPFALEAWFIQILVTCRCDAPRPVLIIGQPKQAAGQCQSCGRIFALQSIGLNAQGEPQFNIAMGSGTPPAVPQPQETGNE